MQLYDIHFGSSWIRTSEGINQRIYNPPPLTTRTPTPKAYIATLSEWQDSNLRPHLPKRRALPNCATLRNHTCIWDGRIRTFDTRNQKPTPCHLATPHLVAQIVSKFDTHNTMLTFAPCFA